MDPDKKKMGWRFRWYLARLLNVIRPRPRLIPVRVEDVLGSTRGETLVNQVNDLYYTGGMGGVLHWRGIELIKYPTDLWMLTELIQSIKPRVVIETGTHLGGSATYIADISRSLGHPCHIITIDINPKWSYDPATRGITSVTGRSTDPAVATQVRALVQRSVSAERGPVMLLLDSDHSAENVLAELRLYASLVTPGSYVVVEDTIVNGHPSYPDHGPGPWEAVDSFLAEDHGFVADRECERHVLTSNPRGWLRRL